jgi:hypothetical protein
LAAVREISTYAIRDVHPDLFQQINLDAAKEDFGTFGLEMNFTLEGTIREHH